MISSCNSHVNKIRSSYHNFSVSLKDDVGAIGQSILKQKPMGTEILALRDNWNLRSDHPPIGARVSGRDLDFNFASWNLMDTRSMFWVVQHDNQGLEGSIISREHFQYVDDEKQHTLRDASLAKEVVEKIISHPTHPKSIVGLQECSPSFVSLLKSELARPHLNFALINYLGTTLLIDQNKFHILEDRSPQNVFPKYPTRTVQDLVLKAKDKSKEFRVINTHLPGDPTAPSLQQLAEYLKKTFQKDYETFVMGDTNFNEVEVDFALHKAFSDGEIKADDLYEGNYSYFRRHSPSYATNMAPDVPRVNKQGGTGKYLTKKIDHILHYDPRRIWPNLMLEPEDVMKDLTSTVALLSEDSPWRATLPLKV